MMLSRRAGHSRIAACRNDIRPIELTEAATTPVVAEQCADEDDRICKPSRMSRTFGHGRASLRHPHRARLSGQKLKNAPPPVIVHTPYTRSGQGRRILTNSSSKSSSAKIIHAASENATDIEERNKTMTLNMIAPLMDQSSPVCSY